MFAHSKKGNDAKFLVKNERHLNERIAYLVQKGLCFRSIFENFNWSTGRLWLQNSRIYKSGKKLIINVLLYEGF